MTLQFFVTEYLTVASIPRWRCMKESHWGVESARERSSAGRSLVGIMGTVSHVDALLITALRARTTCITAKPQTYGTN